MDRDTYVIGKVIGAAAVAASTAYASFDGEETEPINNFRFRRDIYDVLNDVPTTALENLGAIVSEMLELRISERG